MLNTNEHKFNTFYPKQIALTANAAEIIDKQAKFWKRVCILDTDLNEEQRKYIIKNLKNLKKW